MLSFIKQIWTEKDYASGLLFGAIAGVCLWIIALPVSTQVQNAYFQRFHLATPNFVVWSAQQVVPAMYNLENRYWFDRTPLTDQESFDSPIRKAGHNFDGFETGMVNHFPTRKFTFGDARSVLNQNPNGYLYLSSKYRGREIRSSYQMLPASINEIQLKRLESEIE